MKSNFLNKSLAALIALFILIAAIPIGSLSFALTSGDYEYNILNDGTVEITKYKGEETQITIPSTIESKKVTRIGDYTFWGCDYLTSVKIPNSVTSIGDSAFWWCSGFTSITIPNSVTTIGNGAFRSCTGLKSVVIPSSVKSIGVSAFEDCTRLISVTIPNSVTSIGDSAFGYYYNSQKYAYVKIPNFTISGYKNTAAEKYAKEYGFKFKVLSKFTVKYYPNGGTGTMAKTTVTYGKSTQLRQNTFTYTGYTFNGWMAFRESSGKWRYTDGTKTGWYRDYDQPAGWTRYVYSSTAKVSTTTPVDGDVVKMYAVWKPIKFNIEYKATGATGSMKNTIVTYGTPTRLRANAFKKSGYAHKGWTAFRTTDAKWLYTNGTTKAWYKTGTEPAGYRRYIYRPDAKVSNITAINGATIKLYATWTKK